MEEQKQRIDGLNVEAEFKKNILEAGVLLANAQLLEQELLARGYDAKRLALIRSTLMEYEVHE